MAVARVRVIAVAALCVAVVLGGVGLWIVESRWASDLPGCTIPGQQRVAPALSAPALLQDDPTLERVLSHAGCRVEQKLRIGV